MPGPQVDRGADRLAMLLLGVCVAVAALLLWAAAGEPHPDAAGTAHPERASLLSGGDGAARGRPLLDLAWAYGAAAIAFFAIAFALALRRRGQGLGPVRVPFWISVGLYQLAWLGLLLAYAAFLRAPAEAPFVFGFPLPTAIMLFVLWPLPVLFMLIYLRFFSRWVWTAEDEERAARLVAAARADAE